MSAAVAAVVTLTPAMMAEAFWNMSDEDQAAFFDELARVIREESAVHHASVQWHYLGDRLLGEKNKVPREMLMAMAAPLYLNVLRVAEGGAA